MDEALGGAVVICIRCESPTKVIDSRPLYDGRTKTSRVRRRRECTQCGQRFTTFETHDTRESVRFSVLTRLKEIEDSLAKLYKLLERP